MAAPAERYSTADAALAEIMSRIRSRRDAETVSSLASFGRVSAEDVRAPADVPPFPTSHWDGYAVISEDVEGSTDAAPVSLKVVGSAGPGALQKLTLRSGESVRVATGAPLPAGADTVVPVEAVGVDGDCVQVRGPSPPGSHVYDRGEDVRKGEVILRKGQPIRAQDAGLLISLGVRKAKVWRRPKVSVLSTGTELTDARRPKAGRVVNSHSLVFLALLEALGCVPMDLGIAKDDVAEISRMVRGGLARSDVVLTLGGTSAGRHDYVAEALARLNPEVFVHGVKMDRGRVSGIAAVRGKAVLMMPGPIQGAMNAFLLLGVPILEVLSGGRGRATEIPCVFGGTWEARPRYADFRKVVYVKIERGPDLVARPLAAETESMNILARADGFVVVPENVTRMGPGDRVWVSLLPGFSFA